MENTAKESKNTKNQESKIEDEAKQVDWLELTKTFLKGTNLKEIIEAINTGKGHETSLKKDAGSKNLSFWAYKFLKDFSTVLIVLVAVLILSYFDKIENATLGTLLGSIIGYALGNSKNSSGNN